MYLIVVFISFVYVYVHVHACVRTLSINCQEQRDCFWFNGYCAWLCVCSTVVVCPSFASVVAGKLSLPNIIYTYTYLRRSGTHTHTGTDKYTYCLGYAPLSGQCLKQDADVNAGVGNIGQIVYTCVCLSVRVSMFVCLWSQFYSQCPYCLSQWTPSTHTLFSVFVACWILLIRLWKLEWLKRRTERGRVNGILEPMCVLQMMCVYGYGFNWWAN